MKKTLLVIFSLLVGNAVFSQINYPIPMESTSEWRLYRNTWDGSGGPVYYRDFRVFVAGDTLIGNFVYHKLLSSGLAGFTFEGHESSASFSNEFYAYIRNDSSRPIHFSTGRMSCCLILV